MNTINRRRFFKKAISKCLPILGTLVAVALPIKADTIPNGCKDCASTCYNSCMSSCHFRCKGSCYIYCEGGCMDLCVGSCAMLCKGVAK